MKAVIDIRKILIQYEFNTGKQKLLQELADEKGVSLQSLHNYAKTNSARLKFLLEVAEETGLTIQQLIKEID